MPKEKEQQKEITVQEIINYVIGHSLEEDRLPPQKSVCSPLLKENNSLPSFNVAFSHRFYNISTQLSSSSNEEQGASIISLIS